MSNKVSISVDLYKHGYGNRYYVCDNIQVSDIEDRVDLVSIGDLVFSLSALKRAIKMIEISQEKDE